MANDAVTVLGAPHPVYTSHTRLQLISSSFFNEKTRFELRLLLLPLLYIQRRTKCSFIDYCFLNVQLLSGQEQTN